MVSDLSIEVLKFCIYILLGSNGWAPVRPHLMCLWLICYLCERGSLGSLLASLEGPIVSCVHSTRLLCYWSSSLKECLLLTCMQPIWRCQSSGAWTIIQTEIQASSILWLPGYMNTGWHGTCAVLGSQLSHGAAILQKWETSHIHGVQHTRARHAVLLLQRCSSLTYSSELFEV